ncbi:uncharacterized protein LOC144344217, partial [Saccoglossus kowalevskii]
MSHTVKGRRITEPVLIQRGPSPFEKYDDLWHHMREAKSDLRRAERRLEDAETHRTEPYSPLSQETKKYTNTERNVAVDRVPTVELGTNKGYKVPDHRGQYTHDLNTRTPPRKQVTIKDDTEVIENDFTTKNSRITSGYRSHSPVTNNEDIRHTLRDDWFQSERYQGRALDDFESTEKGRYAKLDSGYSNDNVDGKHRGYSAYNDYDANA